MNIRFQYRAGQDEVPALEVLRNMRDLFVWEVRTSLLSGVFLDNPDELDIYGEIFSNRIRLVVRDVKSKEAFEKAFALEDFSQGEDPPAGSPRGDPQSAEEGPTEPALRTARAGDVLNDNPLMPRLSLTSRVSESEFRNERDEAELRNVVSDKVRSLSREYVKEFLKVKALRRETR